MFHLISSSYLYRCVDKMGQEVAVRPMQETGTMTRKMNIYVPYLWLPVETVYAVTSLALRKSMEHLCVRKCHKSNENSCAKTLLVAMSRQPEKSEGRREGEENIAK
jgi:hypothetical protein